MIKSCLKSKIQPLYYIFFLMLINFKYIKLKKVGTLTVKPLWICFHKISLFMAYYRSITWTGFSWYSKFPPGTFFVRFRMFPFWAPCCCLWEWGIVYIVAMSLNERSLHVWWCFFKPKILKFVVNFQSKEYTTK